jgi:hypothetical protein
MRAAVVQNKHGDLQLLKHAVSSSARFAEQMGGGLGMAAQGIIECRILRKYDFIKIVTCQTEPLNQERKA